MRALIWPENDQEAALLNAALSVLAADPPRRVIGDSRHMLGTVVNELPNQMPVVIFHAATRAHVPAEDRDSFDATIDQVGQSRQVFHLALEGSTNVMFREFPGSFVLTLAEHRPGHTGGRHQLAIVEQHGEWIKPLHAEL